MLSSHQQLWTGGHLALQVLHETHITRERPPFPMPILGHVLQSPLIFGFHCAAMSVEPHHTESVAEEAALRPGKPK